MKKSVFSTVALVGICAVMAILLAFTNSITAPIIQKNQEAAANKAPENEYLVTFDCPEFTSLCPMTGQPDFGHIYISYIPRERMVESKSLKLYLFSFRNHGDFHEDCINIIMNDLIKAMDPKYIEVTGYFMPRGGISIYPFANYGDAEHQQLRQQRLLAQLDRKHER